METAPAPAPAPAIDRVTDFETLSLENPTLGKILADLTAEHAAQSDLIDAAEARKKEIMLTLAPLLESLGLRTVSGLPGGTLSRNKGRAGKQSFRVADAMEPIDPETLPKSDPRRAWHSLPVTTRQRAIIAAFTSTIPLDLIALPKLVAESGAAIDAVRPFIDKAEDGAAYYTLRRAKE